MRAYASRICNVALSVYIQQEEAAIQRSRKLQHSPAPQSKSPAKRERRERRGDGHNEVHDEMGLQLQIVDLLARLAHCGDHHGHSGRAAGQDFAQELVAPVKAAWQRAEDLHKAEKKRLMDQEQRHQASSKPSQKRPSQESKVHHEGPALLGRLYAVLTQSQHNQSITASEEKQEGGRDRGRNRGESRERRIPV